LLTPPNQILIEQSSLILLTGWDTDQFLTDVGEATMVMMSVIKNVCNIKETRYFWEFHCKFLNVSS